MNIHGKSGLRGLRRARPALSPERIAANLQAALRWRDEFRAEKAAATQAGRPELDPPSRRGRDDGDDRAAFAKAIARLEFGRAYCDEPQRLGDVTAVRHRPKG
jgi:hypothetical protein